MDEQFAHQVKIEYELERFNNNIGKFGSMDYNESENSLYNQVLLLKAQNTDILNRLSRLERTVQTLQNGDIDLDDVDQTTLDFAQRFSLEIFPVDIIYDPTLGYYSVNEIRINIIYDDNDKVRKTYFDIETINDEFDVEIKVYRATQNINISTFEDFSHTEPDDYIHPETEATDIILNSDVDIANDIMYDWIYFELKVGEFYVDYKTTLFRKGSLSELIDDDN